MKVNKDKDTKIRNLCGIFWKVLELFAQKEEMLILVNGETLG